MGNFLILVVTILYLFIQYLFGHHSAYPKLALIPLLLPLYFYKSKFDSVLSKGLKHNNLKKVLGIVFLILIFSSGRNGNQKDCKRA
jgi:ABC-type uncharacterized transport system permease subunit